MRWFAVVAVCALAVAGCKKPKPPAGPDVTPEPGPVAKADTPAPKDGGTPIPPGFERGGNTNFVQGGGAVQNVRQAGRRPVAMNDFHQLGIAIKQLEIEDNRMPDAAQIKAAIRTFPKIPEAIEEGTIILTGNRDAGGLWAYEIEADVKGGIVLVAGTASRATADETKKLIAAVRR